MSARACSPTTTALDAVCSAIAGDLVIDRVVLCNAAWRDDVESCWPVLPGDPIHLYFDVATVDGVLGELWYFVGIYASGDRGFRIICELF